MGLPLLWGVGFVAGQFIVWGAARVLRRDSIRHVGPALLISFWCAAEVASWHGGSFDLGSLLYFGTIFPAFALLWIAAGRVVRRRRRLY